MNIFGPYLSDVPTMPTTTCLQCLALTQLAVAMSTWSFK